MSSKVTPVTTVEIICDGPHCSDKLIWTQEKPETVPERIHHWASLVLSDRREFAYCSKSCLLDWLRVNETKCPTPQEKAAAEKAKIEEKVNIVMTGDPPESGQSIVERPPRIPMLEIDGQEAEIKTGGEA